MTHLAVRVRFWEEEAMPWPTLSMKESRMEFVRRALQADANFAQLCREYGIARKTGYKWKERALTDGMNGVRERSRRPQSSPGKLDETTVCRLVALKLAHPRWGPKKLCVLYGKAHGQAPSVSSCHRVLGQVGLVAARKRRVRPIGQRLSAALVPEEPNDVWTVDFKGWWMLGCGTRCEPLTVRDAFSRYVLATVVPTSTGSESIRSIFVQLFKQHGLPKVIRSDNGSPFASVTAPMGLSRLSSWWISLGIDLARGRPGHPQDNGAHERMHGDIASEIAAHVQTDQAAQQAALDLWRQEYNSVRPHEALNNRTPAELYRRSDRHYVEAEPEYGSGFLVRKVSANGTMRWHTANIFISAALAGHAIGLRKTPDQLYDVWLYHLYLGTLDPQTCAFRAAPSRVTERTRLTA